MLNTPQGTPSRNAIGGVIFDCDGTLVDSELLNARGVTDLFVADHGIALDTAAIEAEFRGGRFKTMIDTLAERHDVLVDDDFSDRYRTHMDSVCARELEPMPGVRAAIEALAAIDLPLCVASNGPEKELAAALETTGLAGYFGKRVFSAYTLDAWKPEPDLFLTAAAAMDVEPTACAVIEDSDAGVEAARRAGMRVFGYDPAGAIGDHPGAKLIRFCNYADLPSLIAAG